MRIISRKTLTVYWSKNPAAKSHLEAWFAEARSADWATPADIKTRYPSASILKNGRVVFNIDGNRYRLIVHIRYDFRIVYIRFVGSHQEYDRIDAESV